MCRMSERARFLCTALVSSAVLLSLTSAVTSAQPTVRFDPTHTSVLHRECAADTFSVAVTIDATNPAIQGFQLILGFDPTIIEPVAVLKGRLLEESGYPIYLWWNSTAIGDSVHIDVAVLGGTFDGPGELVQIRFYKNFPGTSDLLWRSLDFRDHQNDPIAIQSENGFVEIEGCPVPTPSTTWGRIKLETLDP